MATEEQTAYDAAIGLYSTGPTRGGQRLTIPNRRVTKLSFPLCKVVGSPIGDVTFTIRKVSDDSLIASKVWGDASALPTYPEVSWEEVAFDTPVTVNEEVKLLVEYDGGDIDNYIFYYISPSDVKANEHFIFYLGGSYDETYADYDGAYIYTYTTLAPAVGSSMAAKMMAAGVL